MSVRCQNPSRNQFPVFWQEVCVLDRKPGARTARRWRPPACRTISAARRPMLTCRAELRGRYLFTKPIPCTGAVSEREIATGAERVVGGARTFHHVDHDDARHGRHFLLNPVTSFGHHGATLPAKKPVVSEGAARRGPTPNPDDCSPCCVRPRRSRAPLLGRGRWS